MSSPDITCPGCGHLFTDERVRDYADQLQTPTMVLRGLLRERGCNFFGPRHHLATGDPAPMTEYPLRRKGGGKPVTRTRRKGRRHTLGLVGASWADDADMLHACRDLLGKPRGWRP